MNTIEERNLGVVKDLYPGALWHMFVQLSSIPRGSKNEAAVADFVFNLAQEHRFEVKRDNIGNVVVYVPATPGFEDRPSICLQGHLDMVCEKLKESPHNFATDPIEFVLRDGKLMANGTTLGGDNGFGAAAMLAIIVDDQAIIKHGPLGLLFTVMEEVGFDGAAALDASLISSKLIINLDSEEEGEIFVGCAGGGRVNGTLDLTYVPSGTDMQKCCLTIKDLKGGHSGIEINLGRANAIKLLGRILLALSGFGLKLVTLKGGKKMNSIPREAEATVMFPSDQYDSAEQSFNLLAEAIRREYQPLEPESTITLEKLDHNFGESVLHEVSQDAVLQLMAALPHGVVRLDPNNPVQVETSNNIGIIEVKGKQLLVTSMFRSSVESQMDYVQSTIAAVLQMAGGQYEILNRYPAWEPHFDTILLAAAKDVYQKLYGVEPAVKTIHAGLECAVFARMFPDAEIISFGPTLRHVHSPDEDVEVATVGKFWNFLLALLETYGAPATSVA